MNALRNSRIRETGTFFTNTMGSPVKWVIEDIPVDFNAAVQEMDGLVKAIETGQESERVWLIEHPPLYTAGTSAQPNDLKSKDRFPVYSAGRGGQYTYHGPGQRIAYVMLNLKNRQPDIRAFVASLEEWVIRTLDHFNIKGERREDRVGVWVVRRDKGENVEDKIAAIGIRVRKWVSFHGISINVDPNLEHYSGIVPCGVENHGVTSLLDLGCTVSMSEVDTVLKSEFEKLFGPTCRI